MSLEVKIPKDINEYKEKIIFGMSIRQVICLTSAIILSVGSFFILTKILELSYNFASYIIMLESCPLLAIGFIKVNGFYFEKYVMLFIRHKLGNQIKLYKTQISIDYDSSLMEGGKHAKIFEKYKISNITKISNTRECKLFKITKQGKKRKRKVAIRKIKEARKEYTAAQRRKNKEAKETSSITFSTRNS